MGAGSQSAGIERPSTEGGGSAELKLFVSLAVQWDEVGLILFVQANECVGRGEQWGHLIVMSVECSEGPAQMRYRDGCAEAGTDGAIGDAAGEVCRTESGGEREPREGLEFLVE